MPVRPELPKRRSRYLAGRCPAASQRRFPGEIEEDNDFAGFPALGGGGDFSGMGMVDFDSPAEEDPVDRLRNLIEERKSETVEILRSWLDEKEEAK